MAGKFEPMNNRVLLEPLTSQEKTSSGLVLPDTAREKPVEGKVVAVGPGKYDKAGKRVPVDVKIGDRVVYARYAGAEFKDNGKDYVILEDSSILAKVS